MLDDSHRDKLQEQLDELHEQLDDAQELDGNTKQALQVVAADIQRLMDKESRGAYWTQVQEKWRQAALDFESQHPRLTQTVDQITNLLANIGL